MSFLHCLTYLLSASSVFYKLDIFWMLYNLFLVAVPYSIVIYGINDIYDYDTDIINPKKQDKSSFGSLLKKEYQTTVMRSAIGSALLIMISAILSQNINLILTYSAMLTLGIIYSMPPIRLKTKPFLDSISNVFIYGLILLVPYAQTTNYLEFIISKLSLVFPILGFHILYALMDYEPDKKSNTTTVATKLGLFWSPIVICILVLTKPIFYPFSNSLLSYLVIFIAIAIGFLCVFHKSKYYYKIVCLLSNFSLLSIGFLVLCLTFMNFINT